LTVPFVRKAEPVIIWQSVQWQMVSASGITLRLEGDLARNGNARRPSWPVSYPSATPPYSGMGRPSIAPQKLLRAMLLQGRIEAVAANPGA
jgi:hypothetical protein